MEACSSRELEARNYLEKHRIMKLLNYLTSSLLFYQPEKPREYLISLLERLRIAKVTRVAFPFFMDHSNIVAMFEMMDTSNKGTISFAQYKQGTKGLRKYGQHFNNTWENKGKRFRVISNCS
ncbi:EF-hand calcium-binding domain-containing protein 10 isoform X2 [Saccopteryx bilineata]|uniref:EF-hand calcium-binding domain-containing protein 10 isoform X2 n=1 Tax=Saccopteryx bilineata TaxID=59482 RepID=UPI00338DE18B